MHLRPAGLLALVSAAFAGLVAGLAAELELDASAPFPTDSVPTLLGTAPQFSFAAGALCLVALYATGTAAVQSWVLRGRRFDAAGWLAALLFCATSAASGAALFILASSYVLLDVWRQRIGARNSFVLVCACVATRSLAGFGALVSAFVVPRLVGWLIVGAGAELLLTAGAAMHWFATLTYSRAQPVLLASAAALHVLLHGLAVVEWPAVVVGVGFSFALYPSASLLLVALYKLRDDGWRWSRVSAAAAAAAWAVIAAFLCASCAYFRESVEIAAGVLGAFLLVSALAAHVVDWAVAGFKLSPTLLRSAQATPVLTLAASVALAAWEAAEKRYDLAAGSRFATAQLCSRSPRLELCGCTRPAACAAARPMLRGVRSNALLRPSSAACPFAASEATEKVHPHRRTPCP